MIRPAVPDRRAYRLTGNCPHKAVPVGYIVSLPDARLTGQAILQQ